MKIFVGYGYNPDDIWIEANVFPIIRAFRMEVVTGERVEGGPLPDRVRQKIADCDGMLGFLTHRLAENGTHRWVLDEITTAREKGLQILELREAGVSIQDGMHVDHVHVVFEPSQRAALLTRICEVLGSWSAPFRWQVVIEQGEQANAIHQLLESTSCRCLLRDRMLERIGAIDGEVLWVDGQLIAAVRSVPSDAYTAEVRIASGNLTWTSDFVRVKSTSRISIRALKGL